MILRSIKISVLSAIVFLMTMTQTNAQTAQSASAEVESAWMDVQHQTEPSDANKHQQMSEREANSFTASAPQWNAFPSTVTSHTSADQNVGAELLAGSSNVNHFDKEVWARPAGEIQYIQQEYFRPQKNYWSRGGRVVRRLPFD